eukprot:scaffold5875_cov53-Attheya_sp.AAC.10
MSGGNAENEVSGKKKRKENKSLHRFSLALVEGEEFGCQYKNATRTPAAAGRCFLVRIFYSWWNLVSDQSEKGVCPSRKEKC